MTHSVGIPQSEVGHLNPVVGTSAIGIVAHRYSHRSAVSNRDHRDPADRTPPCRWRLSIWAHSSRWVIEFVPLAALLGSHFKKSD